MGGSGYLRTFGAPVILTAVMLSVAFIVSSLAGVRGFYLVRTYVGAGVAVTFLSVLIWMFVEIARMAIVGAGGPIQRVAAVLRDRWLLLILPSVIFPVFLASYTIAKTSIYFWVGFSWDQFWADIDAFIFAGDPWRYTHALTSPSVSAVWAWVYTAGWGFTLFFCSAFVSLCGGHRKVAAYFTSMTAAWLTGGVIMAYATSAAGPIFAHQFDPTLTVRFEPLRASLDALLPVDSSLRMTQSYLATSVGTTTAVKGGGISAMPSMHLAACTIYVMAAAGTRWLVPAILFWLAIFIGSVHFGYHYAVDGLAAAVIAVPCWLVAEAHHRNPSTTSSSLKVTQIASG